MASWTGSRINELAVTKDGLYLLSITSERKVLSTDL